MVYGGRDSGLASQGKTVSQNTFRQMVNCSDSALRHHVLVAKKVIVMDIAFPYTRQKTTTPQKE